MSWRRLTIAVTMAAVIGVGSSGSEQPRLTVFEGFYHPG